MLIRRKARREVPQLNTTSTADISFMLLIFFLVTTNMDKDTGLPRLLPPADRQKEQQLSVVDKSKTLVMDLKAGDSLLVAGKPCPMSAVKQRVAEFVAKTGTNHLLSLTCSPEADYNAYFQLQNAIMQAYHAVRDSEAKRRYHRLYNQLGPQEHKFIQELVPIRLAEPYDEKSPADEEKGGAK
ncbi:MAG: biopolymer transporter ExbD [Prevotella sp.]|uniref:ExbD/TolR family protein n=1 Tax=Prevotella sp. AGR2160 TaxID=1280674 RepID=UPI0004098B5F|nr:biopolymer transporter ExbD [Prevotella sp. AGR2160]MDD5861694.1 biopolymer transporter ExbD [Prevotella sp.]